MRRLTTLVAVAALLAAAAPAAEAAKRIPYKGKTTGGHTVKFKLGKGRMWAFATGIPTTCLPIQGGGAPMTGADPVSFRWVDVGLEDYKYSEEAKPAFHYNEVTMNYTISTRRARNGTIRGALRLQYQFLIPKYPIGTFSIYSCLGNTRFTTKPA